jgi:hypothetical protein
MSLRGQFRMSLDSPCTNAVTRACPSGSSAAKVISTPIRRTRSGCSASSSSAVIEDIVRLIAPGHREAYGEMATFRKNDFCDGHHIVGSTAALRLMHHTREDSDGQVGSCRTRGAPQATNGTAVEARYV